MNEAFVSPDSLDTNPVENKRFFEISLAASILLHLLIFLYFSYQNKVCSGCFLTQSGSEKAGVTFQIQLLQKIPLSTIATADKKMPVDKKANPEEVISVKPETAKKMVRIQDEHPARPAQNVTLKPDFTTIRSSIDKILAEDNQKIQQAWLGDCKAIKNKTGEVDCLSADERFGLKTTDPYGLSIIFKTLDTGIASKKQQRLYTKLRTNETAVVALLNEHGLDADTRKLFEDELRHLRNELIYNDCGEIPDSGKCKGEVDLVKLASLLADLFDK